jgi:hypothetical protein
MKYALRYSLLMLAFALTTFGLMGWQAVEFSFEGIWYFDNDYRVHAMHILILGLAMIPPALWEIFLLEHAAHTPGNEAPGVDER